MKQRETILRKYAVRCFAVLFCLMPLYTLAQTSTRFIVAFAPGGIADTVARLIALEVSTQTGRPVIVENRAGAGGSIAARALATAPADGSTFLVHTAAFAINASLQRNVGYEPKDFVPVALIASTPEILAVHPSAKFVSLQALVQQYKGKSVSFSTAGIGSSSHITGEYLLRHLGKLDAVHVPYKGGAPAVLAAMSNEVNLVVTSMPAALQQIRQGRLSAIAVTSTKRTSALPEVPTAIESGYKLESLSWVGILAPPGTSPEVVQRLNSEINLALRSSKVRERLEGLSFDPVGGSSEDFGAFIRGEIEQWATLVRTVGVRLDE